MRRFKILSRPQMEALTTPRLLAYRTSILRAHEKREWHYGTSDEFMVKEDASWQELHSNVCEVLSTREHVERKKRG